MTLDERVKQLEDEVAKLLASRDEDQTRMLTMKHKLLDLEQEINKLRRQTSVQRPRGWFGDPG